MNDIFAWLLGLLGVGAINAVVAVYITKFDDFMDWLLPEPEVVTVEEAVELIDEHMSKNEGEAAE